MIAIILAAGKGSRLNIGGKSKFAFSIPFLLLNKEKTLFFKDEFLIENLFKNLKEESFSALFVLGYRFLDVVPILGFLSQKYGKKISYVVNPIFNQTNTAYSLWLALKTLLNEDNNYLDDILIFNGDNFLSSSAWNKINNKIKEDKSFIVVDRYKNLNEESFKIKIDDKEKKVIDMGKELKIEESSGEFIGVSYIIKKDLSLFLNTLEGLLERDKKIYYDLSFIEFSQKTSLDFLYLTGEKWTEIDFKSDLDNLAEILKEDYSS